MITHQNLENVARKAFVKWAKTGMRPLLYNLTTLAGGEYASEFTERAWRTFRAGWFAYFANALKGRTYGYRSK